MSSTWCLSDKFLSPACLTFFLKEQNNQKHVSGLPDTTTTTNKQPDEQTNKNCTSYLRVNLCIHFICTLLFLRTECSIQLWRSKIIFLSDHPFFDGWVGWGFCVHVGFIGRKQFSVTLIEDSVNWRKSWWLMIGGLFVIFFTLERGLIRNERGLNRGRGLQSKNMYNIPVTC